MGLLSYDDDKEFKCKCGRKIIVNTQMKGDCVSYSGAEYEDGSYLEDWSD